MLSTQVVAGLLTVAETTIKRWADEGELACIRTPGGHRKFLLRDVAQFAEKKGYSIGGVAPPPLSAAEVEKLEFGLHTKNYSKISDVFFQEVLQADRKGLVEFLLHVAHHDVRIATIADEVVRPAFLRIGELWENGKLEVSQEHRSSEALIEALARVRPSLHRKPWNGLTAACAVAGGDQHDIGLRWLASTLEAEGWRVHFLGSDTPFDALNSFIRAIAPDLVCVSFTMMKRKNDLINGLRSVGRVTKSLVAKFVVGGGVAIKLDAKEILCDHIASSTHDGIAYIRHAFALKPGPKSTPHVLHRKIREKE